MVVSVPPLSRKIREKLSQIVTSPLKTLSEKCFHPSPEQAETYFANAFYSPEAPHVPQTQNGILKRRP